MSRFLLPLITLTTLALAAVPPCVSGPRMQGSRTCNVNCTMDRPGGDYAQFRLNTEEGCYQACAEDANCVTAQYHYDSGYCYLKNAKLDGYFSGHDASIDCDPVPKGQTIPKSACASGTRTIGSRTCQVTCDSDRPGGDYGSLHTTTYEGCVQACADDNKCVTAVYNVGNGYCYMKSTKNKMTSASNQDTIDCVGVQ